MDDGRNIPDSNPPIAPAPVGERRKIEDTDKYFNSLFGALPVYVMPGEVRCSDSDEEMFVSMLGSGVAVTFFDKDLKIGAACYTLLPDHVIEAFPYYCDAEEKVLDETCKPIFNCINELKKLGVGKNRLRIRLFGGTTLPGDAQDRGTKNFIFVREYLARKGLPVMNEDLGGPYLRRLHFFPSSGRAVRRMLRRQEDYALLRGIESEAK